MALVAGSRSAYAQSAGPNHAGVVVQYANGKVGSQCVAFAEPQISGYELLRRSGLPLVVQPSSMGVAVCSINGTGCSNSANCFCQCQTPGAACAYWTFFEQTAQSQWRLSALGASATSVKNGGMQAWVWGSGEADKVSLMPPALGFDAVCANTPAPREARTATPAPLPSAPAPAPTQIPSPTPLPTLAPSPTRVQAEAPAPSPTRAQAETPTPVPAPTRAQAETPAPASSASNGGTYVAFFALCAGLVGVAVLRRR